MARGPVLHQNEPWILPNPAMNQRYNPIGIGLLANRTPFFLPEWAGPFRFPIKSSPKHPTLPFWELIYDIRLVPFLPDASYNLRTYITSTGNPGFICLEYCILLLLYPVNVFISLG